MQNKYAEMEIQISAYLFKNFTISNIFESLAIKKEMIISYYKLFNKNISF